MGQMMNKEITARLGKLTAQGVMSLVVAAGVWLVVTTSGCNSSDVVASQQRAAGLESAEMIDLGHNDYVRGFHFPPDELKLESSNPIFLDGEYVLDFVPLAERSGGSIQLRIVNGSKDLFVQTFEAKQLRGRRYNFAWRSKLLANPVRIDLSPFQNQTVRMVWTYQGTSNNPAAVAQVKLKPKDPKSNKKPDILLVWSDTHRVDYATSDEGLQLMPRLDRLASDSVVYQRAYSTASWTLPSITSTLTGLFPRRHLTGLRTKGQITDKTSPDGYMIFKDHLVSTYPAKIKTITERLQLHGYTTVLISGNWLHFGSGLFADGQDFAFGGNRWLKTNRAKGTHPKDHSISETSLHSGKSLNRKVLAILQELPSANPLFMIVHYMDAHDWYFYLKQEPMTATPKLNKTHGIEAYKSQVQKVDQSLSELLKLWSNKRGYEQSMIAFLSDHGEHLFDPEVSHGQTMDDVLLHVPLVVKYPQSFGVRPHHTDRVVSLVDLAPTVMDLVGEKWSADEFDGISLLDSPDQKTTRTLFADYQAYEDELSSARRGPMKIVINLSKGNEHHDDLRKPFTPEFGEHGQIT